MTNVKSTTNNYNSLDIEKNYNNVADDIQLKQNNDLMKFVNNFDSKKVNRLTGKRCFGDRTAVSEDSPEQFKIFKSAVLYSKSRRFSPCQNKNCFKQTFNPNKNYFNISKQIQVSKQLKEQQKFSKDFKYVFQSNLMPFNKKASQYSQLVGHNVVNLWGNQYPLMGFQRNQQSRKLQNLDRERMIVFKQKIRQNFINSFHKKRKSQIKQSIKQQFQITPQKIQSKKSKSQTKKEIKTKTKSYLFFSEKAKLRSDRNFLANKQYFETESYLIREEESNLQSYSSNQIYNKKPKKSIRPFSSHISSAKSNFITEEDKLNLTMHKNQSNISNKCTKIQQNSPANHKKIKSTKQPVKQAKEWSNNTCISNFYHQQNPQKNLEQTNQSKNKSQKNNNPKQKK